LLVKGSEKKQKLFVIKKLGRYGRQGLPFKVMGVEGQIIQPGAHSHPIYRQKVPVTIHSGLNGGMTQLGLDKFDILALSN